MAKKIARLKSHGGRRRGAGRKPIGDGKMVKVLVGLSEKHIAQAKELGNSNLSLGVRKALEATANPR